jgi:hypothetical protein
MRFPERPRSVMNYGGPNSYEAAFVGEPPPVPRDAVLLAGPIPADTTVHTITMQRRPYPDLEDQRRPAAEFSLILSDGRRWTVSHHACAEIGGKPVSWMGEHSSRSECIVSEQDLPDGGVDRRVLGSFQRWGMERICRHLQLPPPPAAAARRR